MKRLMTACALGVMLMGASWAIAEAAAPINITPSAHAVINRFISPLPRSLRP